MCLGFKIQTLCFCVINALIKGEIEKPSGQYIGSMSDEPLTCHGLNLNPWSFNDFTFIFVLCGESCLLVSWCAGDSYDMACSDEDHGRSRRPGADNRGWSNTGQQLGGRTIERLGDAVCGLHYEMRSEGFLVWPQNQGRWFVSDLASKQLGQISRFGPQNRQLRFGDSGLKITVMVYWFGPQNQAGHGLSVAP
jgi:hypothetical protein